MSLYRYVADRFVFFAVVCTALVLCEAGESSRTGKASEANKVDATGSPPSRSVNSDETCSDVQGTGVPEPCPTDISKDVNCSNLQAVCLDCDFNCTCVYGETLNVTCRPKEGVSCVPSEGGSKETRQEMVCQYCYQTASWQHTCTGSSKCNSVDTPRPRYAANCTVLNEVLCLGRRTFRKRRECDWTAGYRWSTALALSLTLGGFGADRFYLGHWQEGIGKLFSFGGLGVWTIIDVILIAIRYLGPADGSLYI